MNDVLTDDVYQAARRWWDAGFSVIPVRADGSKAPALPSWKPYQGRRPDEAELARWFGGGANGIGVVWGRVSGEGEALDFDAEGLFDRYEAQGAEWGLRDLLDGLPLVETPSGGRHLLYRCSGPVSGNRKLAQRLTDGRLETLIETRGEGGYTLAPGSPASCHPQRRPYRFLRGAPETVPTISPDDRGLLLALAAVFNEHVDAAQVRDGPRERGGRDGGMRPGDDYNRRGDYESLLERHGWRRTRCAGERGQWQRPGKQGVGISATTNYGGSGVLYVFSSNAAPFEPMTAYTPFAVYALLEHGGDFREAAGALRREGFGDPSPPARVGDVPHPGEARAGSPTPRAPLRRPIADRIVDLADVGPPGEVPYLFGPYLLKGHQHWLTGQTGIGKSTFVYNLTRALAEGIELWDIRCEPATVLYLDTESGDVGRATKVGRLYHDAPRVRGRLLFAREPIRLPDELDALLAFVAENGVSLVVFDTARRCFAVKDENDNGEHYARVVPVLDGLKRAGVASLTLGHPAKNGNGSARGAGAQEDAGDVNLSLTMHGGDVSDPQGVLKLRVTKNRLLGLGVPPLYLRRAGEDRFERVPGDEAVRLAVEEAAETPAKRERCREEIIEYMAGRPNRHASYSQIMEAMETAGHTKSTAKRARQELEEEGALLRAPGGGYVLADLFAE